jgi:WD40 repeat protein
LLNDFGFDPLPNWDPAVSPNLKTLIWLDVDRWLIEVIENDVNRDVTSHHEEVSGLCFDPTGRWLYMAGYRGSRMPARPEPAACEVVRCDPVQVLCTPRPKVVTRTVEFPPNSGKFITVKGSPALNPWHSVVEIPDRKAEITALAVAPDGRSLAAVSDRGAGWVFALPSGERITTLRQLTDSGRDKGVYRLTFSPDGSRLVALGRNGIVCRVLSGSGKGWRSGSSVKAPRDFAFTSDGSALLVTDLSGKVVELETTNGHVIRTHSLDAGPLYGVAVSPDVRRAAVGAADGRIVLWELEA